jgi:hypothetical protein
LLHTTTALPPGPGVATSTQAETALWSAAAFARWLAEAPPGAVATYHRGHLAADRSPGSALSEHQRTRLARLAGEALAAAEAGLVHLVQRRQTAGGFAYLAVKAAHRTRRAAGARRQAPSAAP